MALKALDDFSSEDKARIFDSIYLRCMETCDLRKEEDCDDVIADDKTYFFEFVMMTILGNDIFKELNK